MLGRGTHADGGNLFLRVRSERSKQWIFRFKSGGKVIEISIGPARDRTLKEAREIATEMRKAVRDGANPATIIRQAAPSKPLTFRDYAERLDQQRRHTLKPGRHVEKFINSLRQYVFPFIGDALPKDIRFSDIEAVLKQPVVGHAGDLPFWNAKYETASRVGRRIEAVLDYADRVEVRDRRNPATWKGGLEHAQLGRAPEVKHHSSLDYAELPDFVAELRRKATLSALCLEFIILTAARSGEARSAAWQEIDLKNKVWTLPAWRTKMGREWRVPLSKQALIVLGKAHLLPIGPNSLVFPSVGGECLSDVAVSKALRRLRPGVTVHGFRSTFRTWGAERTSYSNEVLERALSHVDSNKLRAAYQRSDLFEDRAKLAAEWGKYCTSRL